MDDRRRGYLFAFAAYGLWGLTPLYWKLLSGSSATEILAQRIIWSAVLMAGVLLYFRARARRAPGSEPGGGTGVLRSLRDKRRLAGVGAASAAIALNWGLYIYSVTSGHVVQASLGYFINPLVNVVLGVLIFRERLRPTQWAAVGVGFAAVCVLAADYGRPPWISLALAFSFAAYGAVKKTMRLPPAESLFTESVFLALPALAYVFVLGAHGTGTFTASPGHALLLAGGAVVSAVPLLCFGAAANRLPLVALGMIQFFTPVLQFSMGVWLFGEAMSSGRWVGFALVWAALALFSFDAMRRGRRQAAERRAAARIRSGADPAGVTAPGSR